MPEEKPRHPDYAREEANASSRLCLGVIVIIFHFTDRIAIALIT